MFSHDANATKKGVAKILTAACAGLRIYVLLLGGMVFLFLRLPTSFLPPGRPWVYYLGTIASFNPTTDLKVVELRREILLHP